ncbi:MAG: thioredoxin domain-containing protein [Candidatus Paceibacterota bacterium]|jgi:thiol-disulfide isomerase/thioredoxin
MKTYTSWIVTVLAVVLIIGGISWYSMRVSGGPGKYDTFASCIAESKAKFFGAFWCPHCQTQKALFGKSAKKLPYIECSTPDGQGQTPECVAAGIKSYPTWVFADGSQKTGEIPLVDLASSTRCVLAEDVPQK